MSRIHSSLVLITNTDKENPPGKFGTGFVIYQDQRNAWIVTCRHVLVDLCKKGVGGAG